MGDVFAPDAHVEVEATSGIYQRMVARNANPTAPPGKRVHEGLDRVLQYGRPEGTARGSHVGQDAEVPMVKS